MLSAFGELRPSDPLTHGFAPGLHWWLRLKSPLHNFPPSWRSGSAPACTLESLELAFFSPSL